MSKKPFFFFVSIIFFSSFHFAFAGLIINEVMYDLSGADSTNSKSREWIEVYNPDSSAVSIDASIWRIYDGTANRTINNQVNFSIPSSSYVIFAGNKDTFLSDHPGFSGVVYDTGITSLSNTGATLKILDQNGNVVDTVSYVSTQGGAGDGNSLQKISGSWIGATPTPGVVNKNSDIPIAGGPVGGSSSVSSNLSNDSSSTSTSTTIETKTKTAEVPKKIEEPKVKTKIISKTLGFANLPISFQATAYGLAGEQLHYGKYFWNFGDGDSKEVKLSDSQSFTHTYFYPGEYVVSLDYYSNSYIDVIDASSQITIKIIGADISISRVGDEKDFFIELKNNTDYDVDISNWVLVSEKMNFTIPRNTILSPKKTMIISPRITNFSIEDKNTIKLMTPQREVVYDYSASVARDKVVVVNSGAVPVAVKPLGAEISTSQTKSQNKNLAKVEILAPAVSTNRDEQIPVDNLPASTISSDVLVQDEKSPYSSSVIPIISLVFVGAGAGGAYFIRQRKAIPLNESDFEILDE